MSSGTKIPFFSSLEFHENTSAIPLSQKIALCHRWGGVSLLLDLTRLDCAYLSQSSAHSFS